MKFGPEYARRIRKPRRPLGDRWFLDEVTMSIRGRRRYLWRAFDQDGDVLDILVQKRKEKQAAQRFFRKLLRAQGRVPLDITTDKLPSYGAAKKELMPSIAHSAKTSMQTTEPRYRMNTFASKNVKYVA